MPDELTPEQQKYFDSKGQEALPEPEQDAEPESAPEPEQKAEPEKPNGEDKEEKEDKVVPLKYPIHFPHHQDISGAKVKIIL